MLPIAGSGGASGTDTGSSRTGGGGAGGSGVDPMPVSAVEAGGGAGRTTGGCFFAHDAPTTATITTATTIVHVRMRCII